MNIRTELLRKPEFASSSKGALETWLRVLAYCCEQENGGRLENAATWNDRTWMATCGVTKTEVEDAKPLLYDDAVDYFVAEYPEEQEAEVQAKRKGGKKGGKRSAASRASSSPSSIDSTKGKEEGNSKDNTTEKKESPAGYTVPECFAKVDGFTAALGGWIESRKKIRKPPTGFAIQLMVNKLAEHPARALSALNKCIASGWQGFEWSWLEKDSETAAPKPPGHNLPPLPGHRR